MTLAKPEATSSTLDLSKIDYEEIFQSAPDAAIIVDPTNRIVLANRQFEKLFGYRSHDIVGNPIDTLIPQKFHHQHREHLNQYFAAPTHRSMGGSRQLYGKRQDGSEFPVDIGLSPFQCGETAMVAASIRDISERKLLERKLVEDNIELTAFSGTVAHDLQAPLATIIGYCELLDSLPKGQQSADEAAHLGVIKKTALDMSELISDLLDYSRTNRTGEMRVDIFPLNELMDRVLSNLSGTIQEKKARVEFGQLPTLVCNSAMMIQLFQNLVGNGLKYNRSPVPEVKIEVEESDHEIILRFRDNGLGIDPNFFAEAFEPFQRAPGTRESGTGLGLSICKRVVERHGGRIWIESTPGRGSCFWVKLPKDLSKSRKKS